MDGQLRISGSRERAGSVTPTPYDRSDSPSSYL